MRITVKVRNSFCAFCASLWLTFPVINHAQVLGDPVDVGQDFQKLENIYFIGSRVTSFDTATGQGNLQWDRYWRNTTLSFNKVDVGFVRGKASEFPTTEYDQDPVLPFSISFVSPRTIRLRVSTRAVPIVDGQALMLAGPVATRRIRIRRWRRHCAVVYHSDCQALLTGVTTLVVSCSGRCSSSTLTIPDHGPSTINICLGRICW